MVAIFASATALLNPEFVESFEPEKLASKFVKVEKEFGVKFNKTNSTFNIVGHWEAIQSAHRSLRRLVAAPPIERSESHHKARRADNADDDDMDEGRDGGRAMVEGWDGGGPTETLQDGMEEKENIKKARRDEKMKGGLTAAPVKGNPKRGRYTLESSRPSLVPDPVVYVQYQDRSYMSEDVLDMETVLDAFEETLPVSVRNHCKKSDIKKVLEKNTEQMGRPLHKRRSGDAEVVYEYHIIEQGVAAQIHNQHDQGTDILGHSNMQLPLAQMQNHLIGYTEQGSVLSDVSQMTDNCNVPNSMEPNDVSPHSVLNNITTVATGEINRHHLSSVHGVEDIAKFDMRTNNHYGGIINSGSAENDLRSCVTNSNILVNNSRTMASNIADNAARTTNSGVVQNDLMTTLNSGASERYTVVSMSPDHNDLKTISVEQLAHIRDSPMDTGNVTAATPVANLGHVTGEVEAQLQQQGQEQYTEIKYEQSDDDRTLDNLPSTPDVSDSDCGLPTPDPSPVKGKQETTNKTVTMETDSDLKENKNTTVDVENVSVEGKKPRCKPSPAKLVNGTEVAGEAGKTSTQAANVSKGSKVKAKPTTGQASRKASMKASRATKPRPPATDKPRQTVDPKPKPNKVSKPSKPRERRKPREPHPKKEPTIYKCTECDYQGRRKKRLTEHMGRVHGLLTANCEGRIKNKSYPCDECDKAFVFGKDLSRHKKIVHHGLSHFCTICQKSYKSKYVYDKHMATHEAGYVQPMFTCQLCCRQFTTKFSLSMHIKSEHLGIKKTFLCPTCGKSFSQIRSYRQHANVHAGIRPYVCEVCGKTFTYDKSLKEHRYMHDNIRRFPCSICGKAFRQRTCLLIHMKVHKESKDHMCSSCGKGFTQKQSLIRHERIHSGVKPYTCALCGKSFSDYAVIRKHMLMSHKKEKETWKVHCIQDPQQRSEHYISGGPGYVPRVTSHQIRQNDGASEPVGARHDTRSIIDAKDVPQPQELLAANVTSDTSMSTHVGVGQDEIYRKVAVAPEHDITSLVSTSLTDKMQAAGFVTGLYAAQVAPVPQQQLTIPTMAITNIKSQPVSEDQISTVPINYSVPQTYTVAGPGEHLTEESIMNSFLKSDVYRQVARQTQGAHDMFSPILTPLAAASINTVNVGDTAQRGQAAGFPVTSVTETVLAQPSLGTWGYAGYPAYYNPANFPQFQGPQN